MAELRKWIGRNRGFAAALGLLLLVFLTSGFIIGGLERKRANETALHLDEQLAAVLVAEVDGLWPVHPDTIPRMDRWLRQARDLAVRLPERRDRLADIIEGSGGELPTQPSARERELDFERTRLEAFCAEYISVLPHESLLEA